MREHIGAALGEAQASATRQIVPTARVKKVIELSFEEARASGHNYVGTEHLLVGLLAEGEGLAARALAEQGVTLDGARAEIDRLAGQAATEPPGRPPGGGEPAMSPEVAGLLSRARMRAAAGQSRSIRLEHLLEAIGDGAGGGAVRALLDLQAARARKAKGMAEQPEHAAEEHAGEERRLEEAFQQALAAWQETLKAPPGEPPPS